MSKGSTPHPGPLPGRGGEGEPIVPSRYALALGLFPALGCRSPARKLATKEVKGEFPAVSTVSDLLSPAFAKAMAGKAECGMRSAEWEEIRVSDQLPNGA